MKKNSQGGCKVKLKEKTWEQPDEFINYWILDKFNILPTDERFLALYDEQKTALFEGINQLPDNVFLKRINSLMAIKNKIKEKPAIEFIEKSLRNRMIQDMKKRNMTVEEIEKDLKEIGQQKKNLELKDIENKIKGV